MPNIGLSKPYYAVYNNNNGAVSYSAGALMARAVEANVDIEAANDNNFYSDNGISETDRTFAGGTLSFSPDNLTDEVAAAMLGLQTQAITGITGVTDADAVEIVYDDDQQTPYLGFGFIVKKRKNNQDLWRAIVLTKIMFSVPSGAYTTQGETIDWQVDELEATIMRDDTAKHAWKREATFTSEDQAEAYIKAKLNIAA